MRATPAAGEASSSSVDDLDQPLPPATQLELERAFLCKFSWRKLPAGLVGCNSLLGRCQREFQRRTVTALRITRARNRSQAAGAVHTRRKRVFDKLLITFGADCDVSWR